MPFILVGKFSTEKGKSLQGHIMQIEVGLGLGPDFNCAGIPPTHRLVAGLRGAWRPRLGCAPFRAGQQPTLCSPGHTVQLSHKTQWAMAAASASPATRA